MQSFVSRLVTATVAAVALCASGAALAQKVRLATSAGDIVIELDAAKSPKTVANFLEYVKAGHYDGTIFHRVIENFMIQGGGMTADMKEKADARADPAREPQRPDQPARHGRDGANAGPELGDRAVLHQRQGQRLPQPGAVARRQRLCRLRQGRRRGWTSSTRSARRPPAPATFPCSRS